VGVFLIDTPVNQYGQDKGDASVSDDITGNRRDFLYVATAATGAVGAGAVVWPLVNQMNPSADVQALSSIEVDVSGVEPGAQITVKWRGKPVFIRRRSEDEIAAARDVNLAELPDDDSRNANMAGDAADINRTLDEAGEWLVMMGVCTHLGCVPLGDAGDFGGWFCPCHGSHYDTAGRIRKGPAPENLPVPVATFVNDTTIKLG
jgi:ubiquinol-cytochrome c reductase iron-sulfur subunit